MICNFDKLSFQILTIDRFFHKKGFYSVKARPYAALSFRVKGSDTFRIGGKTFLVNPGEVLFIPADVPYEVEYSVSESIVANLLSCNYSEAELLSFESPAEGAMLFLQLLEGWQTEHSVNQAKASIYGILEKINRGKRKLGENAAFAACLRYVESHFQDPTLDVCDVCSACFVSRSSLQREFLEHFGISPKQYIIKLRMNLALRLLAEARLPVREIAPACGFLDEKYFSRAFKKQYGCSPSEMRKKISV